MILNTELVTINIPADITSLNDSIKDKYNNFCMYTPVKLALL